MRFFVIVFTIVIAFAASYESVHKDVLNKQYRTLYSQGDPLWKGVLLVKTSRSTIGKKGCYLVALSMIASDLDSHMNPLRLQARLSDIRAFGPTGGLEDRALPEVLHSLKLVGRYTSQPKLIGTIISRNAKVNDNVSGLVRKAIQERRYVLAKVDGSPKTIEFTQHWVIIEQSLQNDFLIIDPDGGVRTSLRKKYGNGNKGQSLNTLIVEGVIYAPKEK